MRKIAIFTDVHGLLEPLDSTLKDIKSKGIDEIYSLGDVVGLGPNPKEVLELLKEYNVHNIMGNCEEYVLLGGEPFTYFKHNKKDIFQKWTDSKLSEEDVDYIKSFKHSFVLNIGSKKVGLCHFINDVRIDYDKYSTWSYQDSLNENDGSAIKQFYYANSKEQKELINSKYNSGLACDKGYLSCYNDPILEGYPIEYFDQIFQGHVHFASEVKDENVIVTTLRAVAVAYEDGQDVNKAYYVVLEETENGYKVEDCFVKYDREKMLKTIMNCDFPSKDIILKYVNYRK